MKEQINNIKIGYACIPMAVPFRTNRGFLLKNLTERNFYKCVEDNIMDLKRILNYNLQEGIKLFRISSDIIPFGSHANNNFSYKEEFKEQLKSIGEYIVLSGIRVSMHPGQYTVLNSETEATVTRAISDIEYQCGFLQNLNLPKSHKVVIHVGGLYGNKEKAMERFMHNFEKLSQEAKGRLIIENDDKTYNALDVLDLCNELKVPMVFDNLHHFYNPPEHNMPMNEILYRVQETWREEDGPMKLHYSDMDLQKKKGAHSKTVDSNNFMRFLETVVPFNPDIMLEVKDKDISAIKCNNLFREYEETLVGKVLCNENLVTLSPKWKTKNLTEQWARYKYLVMEKDYDLYKKASSMVKNNCSIREFYCFIDKCLNSPTESGNFINACQHIMGYYKDKVTISEKLRINKLLSKDEDPIKNMENIKRALYKLAVKYKEEYLLKSYFYYYNC